jgi:hypothetical protein
MAFKNLWIRETFIERYYQELPNHATMTEAYEATEDACEEQNGRRKYSDYNSFRQVLRRYIINRKRKR